MLRLSTAMLLAVISSACTHSNEQSLKFETKGYAFAPPAFSLFCTTNTSLCSTQGTTKVVQLDAKRRQQLDDVNSLVNRIIRERSDGEDQGKEDVWRVPVNQGDCEDFAILKKKKLLELGWPASALLLTVAWHKGNGHMVLTAKTSEGDLVLDNRNPKVKNWNRTPYNYYAIQSQEDSRSWERILKPS